MLHRHSYKDAGTKAAHRKEELKLKNKLVSLILTAGMAASLMAGYVSGQEAEVSDTAIPDNVYVICVQDAQSGEPVADAMIQLCDGTSCMMEGTDEDGNAIFEAEAGDYTAHVLKVPEGYEDSSEELVLTANERSGIYQLNRSGEEDDLEDIDVIGTKVSFETTDLDGNPVKSEDLFAGHKVTMINNWATWCGPCCGELPELAKLAAEIGETNCQIIGICDDTLDDEKAIGEARKLLSESGADYINLIQKEEIRELLPLPAYPCTYYVDSEGTILTKPVVGALVDSYYARLEEALAAVGE